jgi:CheY-specific phosphatase CheX
MNAVANFIDEVAADCCASLVPPGAARPLPVVPVLPPSELVAVIGFSGDQVRGAMGLCAGVDALRATHPSTLAGAEVEAADLEDWIGESANQLLGRLKAELQRRGVCVWMGTPIVLRGVAVSVLTSGNQVRRFALELGSGHQYMFWLDIENLDGSRIGEPLANIEREPPPGALLMF